MLEVHLYICMESHIVGKPLTCSIQSVFLFLPFWGCLVGICGAWISAKLPDLVTVGAGATRSSVPNIQNGLMASYKFHYLLASNPFCGRAAERSPSSDLFAFISFTDMDSSLKFFLVNTPAWDAVIWCSTRIPWSGL